MARPHPQKTALREMERAEQDLRIVALKRRGLTYDEIAEETGIPRTTCRDAMNRAMRQAQADLYPEAALYVVEHMAQLGALLSAVWDRAMRGDDKAIGEARRLILAMADLDGSKAPIRHEFGESDVDRQIRELTQLLDERSRAVPGQAADLARPASAGEALIGD